MNHGGPSPWLLALLGEQMEAKAQEFPAEPRTVPDGTNRHTAGLDYTELD